MAADVSLPANLEYNHDTLIKLGFALTYSTPFYRTLTMNEAIADLYSRTSSNLTSPATISEVLGADFQRTEQQIPLFLELGKQKAGLVAFVLSSYFKRLPHEDMSDMLMVPAVVLLVFTILAVVLRFFTRYFITKMLRLEDWLILPGLVFAIGTTVSIGTSEGLGVHIWDVPLNQILRLWRAAIILQHFIILCHFFVKSSLLVFYYRLSPKPSFRIAVIITATVNAAHTISNLLAVLFSCKPIIWSDALFTAKCTVNRYAVNFSGVVIFMVLDLVIILLPIPYILRLQLKKRKKVLMIGLFSLGALVVFASGMKVARLHDLSYNVDTTWQIDNLQWTLIELNLGIICACAPSFLHLTSPSRLKRFYHEYLKPLTRFFPHKPQTRRNSLDDRKVSIGTSEATASSRDRDLALQKLNTNTKFHNNLTPIPPSLDIRSLNPHHNHHHHRHYSNHSNHSNYKRTFKVGARTSSLPAIEIINTIKPSHLHPSPTFKPRPSNLKILSKDDIDLIEQGYSGLGLGNMETYNYSEDDQVDIENESIYTHDLTRASSRALPEDLENCGFSIVPRDAASLRAGS
ncbi:hypothetical protein TWF970_000847 [Orbilia oligospora]|uniref:Rhodopsin domain-containing protein n=1 Tax=Orbilia oligospora TaxID=2813651 RepID=A0A7C8VT43_ORBOL|nr:hypothetical protein TWF970_000847 [Orbilia oligospora]